jgi:hypothetical protein
LESEGVPFTHWRACRYGDGVAIDAKKRGAQTNALMGTKISRIYRPLRQESVPDEIPLHCDAKLIGKVIEKKI